MKGVGRTSQVSAVMKTFLDRLGFLFHRPRFHGKTFTPIVVQGCYRGDKVVKYLDQGWFDSDYYQTRLGPFKTAVGATFDWMAARASKQRECR